MVKFIFLILALFVGQQCIAQCNYSPSDSVRKALLNEPGFRLGFDGRNSFLNGNAVKIWGGRYGFDFGKIAFFTGYYNTSSAKFRGEDTVLSSFRYVSSTFEYYVHQSYRFEVVTSYQIGLGNRVEFEKKGTQVVKSHQQNIVPIEFGVGGTVRFLRYFGYTAGIGVRTSLINSNGFSGPYYFYGLTFFTGTMYRDAKKQLKKWNLM